MSLTPIVLRYHEIALKKGNRGRFEGQLIQNARKLIQRSISPDAEISSERYHGRIVLNTEWNELTEEALKKVFGLSTFSPMRVVSTDKQALLKAALEEFEKSVRNKGMPRTFRVATRRSEKAIPETSMEIDRWIGSAISDQYPELKVDLENPERTLGIEIRYRESFIWTEKIPGPSGLPVGSNGPVMTLISGGLDSPVAAILILRRGSPTSFIHFHGTPFVGEEALEKVENLVRIVNRLQPDPKPLYLIPFGKIQEKIASKSDPKMRTLLFRRMMIRISNQVAHRVGAQALITGESLGQVASQTLENLSVINQVAEIPILRPLIAFNKEEIIALAEKWGTFKTSIQPALDCCTLFADRHPVIKAKPWMIEDQEKNLDIPSLVQEALDQLQTHSL